MYVDIIQYFGLFHVYTLDEKWTELDNRMSL